MTPERFARLKEALARRQHDLTVLADGVHKNHNISAIIRTCDAVGIAMLHAISGHGAFRRHHMVAGGSKRWIDVELHPSAEAAFARFRDSGLTIIGAELRGPSPYAIAHADATGRIRKLPDAAGLTASRTPRSTRTAH